MSIEAREFDKARAELKKAIYKAAVNIFEIYEHIGKIFGSGHHAAQKVAEDAGIELLMRWNNKENKDEKNNCFISNRSSQ